MTFLESNGVIQKMNGLWPRWSPTDEEVDLWRDFFKYHSEFEVSSAIQQSAFESNYNTPPRNTIKKLIYSLKQNNIRGSKILPEPTSFIMYLGGGKSSLLAGFFYPVVFKKDRYGNECDHDAATDNALRISQETYGGEWKIVINVKWHDMNIARLDIRKRA